jgi:hypothetical protein
MALVNTSLRYCQCPADGRDLNVWSAPAQHWQRPWSRKVIAVGDQVQNVSHWRRRPEYKGPAASSGSGRGAPEQNVGRTSHHAHSAWSGCIHSACDVVQDGCRRRRMSTPPAGLVSRLRSMKRASVEPLQYSLQVTITIQSPCIRTTNVADCAVTTGWQLR